MAEGWLNDPFGRYEERFFAAGRPTRFVRSGGVDLLDHLTENERDAAVEERAEPTDTVVAVDELFDEPEPVTTPGVSEVDEGELALPPFPLPQTRAPAMAVSSPATDAQPRLPGVDAAAGHEPTPDRGWRAVPAWQWMFAAGVFILVGTAMVAGVLYTSHAGPFRRSSHRLTGSVTLLHQAQPGTATATKDCAGTASFKDVHAGVRVGVTAGRKEAVSAALSAGSAKHVAQRGPFVLFDCVFQFTGPRVPRAPSYAVKVGPYSGAIVPYSQLSKAGWSLSLRLQSSQVPGGAPQLRLMALSSRVSVAELR